MRLERKIRRTLAKESGTLRKGKAPGTWGKHIVWSSGYGHEYHATKGYRTYRA